MKASFPISIEGRSGEKLLQGLLVQALTVDPIFRRAFCQWLGFTGTPNDEIEAEFYEVEGERNDIVISFLDNEDKLRIELKVSAGLTQAQKSEEYCQVLIAPQNRKDIILKEMKGVMGKSWEEFYREFEQSPTIQALFSGLIDFIGVVQELDYARVRDEFSAGFDPEDKISKSYGFLKGLVDKIKSTGLKLKCGPVCTSQLQVIKWNGMNIDHIEFPQYPDNVWLGFLYGPGTIDGPYADKPHLVLQWPEKVNGCPDIPRHAYELSGGNKLDIDINQFLSTEELLTIDDTWKVIEPILHNYEDAVNSENSKK